MSRCTDYKIIYLTELKSFAGMIYIAASAKGIVCLDFDEAGRRKLIQEILKDCPATISKVFPKDRKFRVWIKKIKDFLSSKSEHVDIPLAVPGTKFQRDVWNYLKRIPKGQTRSYSQIASSLGNKKACRAVANACRANKIALIIPCHRVIRSDKSLAGYRWGTERKRKLLSWEGCCGTKNLLSLR